MKTWTSEGIETMNSCFEIADWDVFLSDSSIDSAAEVIFYINFCVDMTINTKQIRYFGNDKPWVCKQLKTFLRQKRDPLKQNDKDKVKSIQRDIDKQITVDKRSYKAKLEDTFTGNDPRQYWKGIETITGYKARKSQLQTGDDARLAEELNSFYTRFDKYDFSDQQKEIMEEVHCRQSQPVQISQEAVRTCFLKVKTHSAAGPDNISGKTLKERSDSLASIFTKLFQRSLDEGTIPSLWKTSTIIPVAKKPSPKEMNDYRPVALTSIAYKWAEIIILRQLWAETASKQDPLQFACKQNRNTEDAVLTLLHHLYEHLDRQKTYARVLFIDFSSAFNTIQPHLMVKKLLAMSVNPALIKWLFSFLTGRTQWVRVGKAISSARTTNTGAPQGCVLSPALFTLEYSADCRSNSDANLLIKFADDTSLTGLVERDEAAYRGGFQQLVEWCDSNFLVLNVSKTKELVVDFRVAPTDTGAEPFTIKGQSVEMVSAYKYLGTVIDNKLSWTSPPPPHTHTH